MQIGDHYTDLDILDKIKRFYENLYKQTEPANINRKMKTHFLSDEIYPTLTDDERAECDKEITVTELTHALSLLNKDSAPGSDGLPPSFYTHFWEKRYKFPFLNVSYNQLKRGSSPLL